MKIGFTRHPIITFQVQQIARVLSRNIAKYNRIACELKFRSILSDSYMKGCFNESRKRDQYFIGFAFRERKEHTNHSDLDGFVAMTEKKPGSSKHVKRKIYFF